MKRVLVVALLSTGIFLFSGLAHAVQWYVRTFQCDDRCEVYLNGSLVSRSDINEDSGWINITKRLRSGINRVKFEVINTGSGVAYHIQVRRDNTITFDASCGEIYRYGCDSNTIYPTGSIYSHYYTIRY